MRWSADKGLTYHLTNQAILKLFEGLRQTWFAKKSTNHSRPDFIHKLTTARQRVLGWLEAYGFTEWSPDQLEAVTLTMGLAFLDDAILRKAVEECGKRWHTKAEDRLSLIKEVAFHCGRTGKKGSPYTIEDVAPFGGRTLEELREGSRRRFRAAMKTPADLPWGYASARCQPT